MISRFYRSLTWHKISHIFLIDVLLPCSRWLTPIHLVLEHVEVTRALGTIHCILTAFDLRRSLVFTCFTRSACLSLER